jgi:hypothetical protein
LSELTDSEREAAITGLSGWFGYTGKETVVHPKYIKGLIEFLRGNTSTQLGNNERCYLALSYPKINSEDNVNVEGLVGVTYAESGAAVTMLEINPVNRDAEAEIMRDIGGIFEWVLTVEDRDLIVAQHSDTDRRRFIGVGRQLLFTPPTKG